MKSILLDKRGKHVAVVTINNPAKQNALDAGMMDELTAMLKKVEDDKAARIIYLTGAGNASFSTGAFLKDLVEFRDASQARAFAELLKSTMDALFNFPRPVISLINGYALGGGFGLAMSSDIRIMTEAGRIGFPAVKIGAILPHGCTLRLIGLVGTGHAKELLLTGRQVKADEALRMGLVHYVVEDRESLFSKADELSEQIMQGSSLALSMAKATVNQHTNELIYRYSLYSPDNFAYLSSTEDWNKRISAFLNRKNNKD